MFFFLSNVAITLLFGTTGKMLSRDTQCHITFGCVDVSCGDRQNIGQCYAVLFFICVLYEWCLHLLTLYCHQPAMGMPVLSSDIQVSTTGRPLGHETLCIYIYNTTFHFELMQHY